MTIELTTACGRLRGNQRETCREFLGVPYAHAERFRYAVPTEQWEGEADATKFGPACPQSRAWYEHLDVPERKFYHREFRDGMKFEYGEDCLRLNIYTPLQADHCPVIVFFHGGGFNSGAGSESPFDGAAFAQRGVILVTAQYRVGVLGYLTHEDIRNEYGRNGNFGLDDQRTAVLWVKEHIADFGGDADRITLLGQSAGAISIQYLCLDPQNKDLFQRAVMMSGGGMFPRFALPRRAERTEEYWLQLMKLAGCRTLDELRKLDAETLFAAVETLKQTRKDNTYNTMPVVDGRLLPAPVPELIRSPLPLDYMIGYTNNDMYAPVMGYIGHKFARQNDGYVYYFDADAPGDDNRAFHSSDLRYVFGTLSRSWRPYSAEDERLSRIMTDSVAAFARSGDPNGEGRPRWERGGKRAMRFSRERIGMCRPEYGTMLKNMLQRGEPK